jgi:hypothetical protein
MLNLTHANTSQRHQLEKSPLDKFITELISKRMGINPEEVTTEFIHIWREKEFYPTARFERVAGAKGGGRKALTGNELEAQRNKADAFFSTLTNGNRKK